MFEYDLQAVRESFPERYVQQRKASFLQSLRERRVLVPGVIAGPVPSGVTLVSKSCQNRFGNMLEKFQISVTKVFKED
jgi:hypothetical protein